MYNCARSDRLRSSKVSRSCPVGVLASGFHHPRAFFLGRTSARDASGPPEPGEAEGRGRVSTPRTRGCSRWRTVTRKVRPNPRTRASSPHPPPLRDCKSNQTTKCPLTPRVSLLVPVPSPRRRRRRQRSRRGAMPTVQRPREAARLSVRPPHGRQDHDHRQPRHRRREDVHVRLLLLVARPVVHGPAVRVPAGRLRQRGRGRPGERVARVQRVPVRLRTDGQR